MSWVRRVPGKGEEGDARGAVEEEGSEDECAGGEGDEGEREGIGEGLSGEAGDGAGDADGADVGEACDAGGGLAGGGGSDGSGISFDFTGAGVDDFGFLADHAGEATEGLGKVAVVGVDAEGCGGEEGPEDGEEERERRGFVVAADDEVGDGDEGDVLDVGGEAEDESGEGGATLHEDEDEEPERGDEEVALTHDDVGAGFVGDEDEPG